MNKPPARFEVTPAGRAALEQCARSEALVRIRCEPATLAFVKECYEWWRDGCSCVACRVIDNYEADLNGLSDSAFMPRMKILSDAHGGTHGDGCWYGELLLRNAGIRS